MAWSSVLHALLFFLPAYVANMSPLLVAKVVPGWNTPIDGGRLAKDGRRVLGKGKTWRGLTGGTLLGAVTAVVVAVLVPAYDAPGFFQGWDYGLKGFAGPPIGSDGSCDTESDCDLPTSHILAVASYGAILGFAALVGDAVKSYFKRRVGKEGGAPWVPFDQLDFVLFGLAAAFAAAPLLADGWVMAALLDDWVVLTTLVVLTPLLHFLVNVIGYWLKLKDVPW
ncbi:MAG TPA: CDP-2,3-bis-(O-geranylgeranyl)-sn-glycerol synthase [Candidatus Thermoplasmatota archaeon]|nr:CDP-2,3-bis-(O-geranylgeranyl)-sn-glycerol synthase [Candidatus Thermoplasmatota archaeon]